MIEVIKQKQIEKNDVDYTNEEGLIICGKCNTAKQIKLNWLNEGEQVVNTMCSCEQAEYERKKEEDRQKVNHQIFLLRQNAIDKPYRDVYLKNSDTPLKPIENYIKKFNQFYEKNIGLMIYGEVGNGKTFMASVIANELCKAGYSVMMLHTTEALNRIADFDLKEEFIREIRSCDLLILDDFGVSRETEYQKEQLNLLIDTRYAIKTPLVITTNLTRDDLAKPNDLSLKRTYDRVIEMTHPLLVNSKGRRMNIAKKRFKKVESMLGG